MFLLDQYLSFDGTKGLSPVVQELAVELAVTGVSYRQAGQVKNNRAKLIAKRHYIHQSTQPFWEGFETFLMDTYDYDPTKHHLVINGDGAQWIAVCRDYFRDPATFVIDRFHVARDIRAIFRDHPRCREIQKKHAAYAARGLLLELNRAVGILGEEHLEKLINQLSQYPVFQLGI